MPPQGRLFYGWYVIASAFTVLFLVQGAKSVIGVTFKPIIAEFAWSRGDISLAVLLNMTVYALSMTAVGRLYDRFGARWVVGLSSLCLALGFVGVARATALWHFLVWYGVVAAVGFGGTGVPLFAALASKWFQRHRGLVVSLALSGGCLGQFVVVHGASQWVLAHHWRGIYLIIGLLAVGVNLALALAVIRNSPVEIGLRPFGAPEKESVTSGKAGGMDLGTAQSGLR
jgi:sugar phosphate permease